MLNRAVEGHFNHPHERPWMPIADTLCPTLAHLVGAKTEEVACMSTLTANLHLMMTSFYKPTKERFKIVCEAKAFPSDRVSCSLDMGLQVATCFPFRTLFE